MPRTSAPVPGVYLPTNVLFDVRDRHIAILPRNATQLFYGYAPRSENACFGCPVPAPAEYREFGGDTGRVSPIVVRSCACAGTIRVLYVVVGAVLVYGGAYAFGLCRFVLSARMLVPGEYGKRDPVPYGQLTPHSSRTWYCSGSDVGFTSMMLPGSVLPRASSPKSRVSPYAMSGTDIAYGGTCRRYFRSVLS
eukprot:3942002-Rhodomonas_salina.4